MIEVQGSHRWRVPWPPISSPWWCSSQRPTWSGAAQAALPKLQEVTAQIDKTGGAVGQLTAEQRKAIAAVINPLMPAVNQVCDKVLAIPGVAEVLKPSVDTLKARLTAFVT
jgi:hypothetical protein